MEKLMTLEAATLMAGSTVAQLDSAFPNPLAVQTAAPAPTFGCRSHQDADQGCQDTALFLSDYSGERHNPDLIFNMACGSEDFCAHRWLRTTWQRLLTCGPTYRFRKYRLKESGEGLTNPGRQGRILRAR